MRNPKAVLLVVPILASLHVGRADADVLCGATHPNNDVPNGYLVTSRAKNTVATDLLSGVGEYRTHTMLSHGQGWFTHASMKVPKTSTSKPHFSPSELRYGQPGASQIQSAAAYVYLYDAGNGGLEYIAKQKGSRGGVEYGASVTNWIWSNMPYGWVASGGYYQLYNGAYPIRYSLHQYANISTVHQGNFGSVDGVVCSTLVSYAVNKALGWTVRPVTYNSTQVFNGIITLRDSVKDRCMKKNGSWFKQVFGGSNSKCGDAANQVCHCTINPGSCGSSANTISVPNSAYSISPDAIAGWMPGRQQLTLEERGPWVLNATGSVNFSGGGTSYTCWGG